MIIYIARLFQCEDWFQYDQQTSHFTHCTDHVSLNLLEIVFDKPYQIFIFSQNDSPLKTMKNVFYFI